MIISLFGGNCRLYRNIRKHVQLLRVCGFRPQRGRVGKFVCAGRLLFWSLSSCNTVCNVNRGFCLSDFVLLKLYLCLIGIFFWCLFTEIWPYLLLRRHLSGLSELFVHKFHEVSDLPSQWYHCLGLIRMVLRNRVLLWMFIPKKVEERILSFMICTPHQILHIWLVKRASVRAAYGSTEHGNGSLCQRLARRSDFWLCASFTGHVYFLSFSSIAAHKQFGVYYIMYSCL